MGYVQGEFAWPEEGRACEVDHRCQWETRLGYRCTRQTFTCDYAGLRLCKTHLQDAERWMSDYLKGNTRLLQEMYWEILGTPRLGALPHPGRSVVYFVERQGFVKIGTTTNLDKRLRDIGKGSCMPQGMTVGPVRLVATMPGDQRHEKFLHNLFSDLQLEGEWFLPDTRLCGLIARQASADYELLQEIEIRHGMAAPDEGDADVLAS